MPRLDFVHAHESREDARGQASDLQKYEDSERVHGGDAFWTTKDQFFLFVMSAVELQKHEDHGDEADVLSGVVYR
jgi:hypothetical protein